jgi:hypothetical protein
MLIPQGLSVVEDVPGSVVEYVLVSSIESIPTNSNHSVVFIQDSSGFGYDDMPNQSLPPWPLLFSSSLTLLNARVMAFGFDSGLTSSRYIARAARRMCLDLREARENVR